MSLVFERIQTKASPSFPISSATTARRGRGLRSDAGRGQIRRTGAREEGVDHAHFRDAHPRRSGERRARAVRACRSAKIFVSHEGGARYGFDHEKVKDGDKFTFGKTVVTVRHTPGHTPEHVSYRARGEGAPRHAVGRAHRRLALRQLGRPARPAGLERDGEAGRAAVRHAARVLPQAAGQRHHLSRARRTARPAARTSATG